MKNRFGHLEFGVSCLADIRFLLKAWQLLLVREGLKSSESDLVRVIVEDRLPGEEVKLTFWAAQKVLIRFLQSLEDQGVKFTCHEFISSILTMCRIVRDRGAVQAIGSKSDGG
jgi:hypothetical protein